MKFFQISNKLSDSVQDVFSNKLGETPEFCKSYINNSNDEDKHKIELVN